MSRYDTREFVVWNRLTLTLILKNPLVTTLVGISYHPEEYSRKVLPKHVPAVEFETTELFAPAVLKFIRWEF
jgi:hypothetical protein